MNWKNILTGMEINIIENQLLTIICYEIYKKFLHDREHENQIENIINYMGRQLNIVRLRYSTITSKQYLIPYIADIICIIEDDITDE